MKKLDFKEKARILNNALSSYGTEVKHGQALNILAKIEGYETYADYTQKQKNTQSIEISKEIWDSFVSKRKDFGVPVEVQLETLIDQEIYQTKDDVKLYKYEDKHFDTYLVFAKSKRDAFSIIDSGVLPPYTYDIGRVKEINLETLYGIMIRNTWKGIDSNDGQYNIFESELAEIEGSGMSLFPETLIAYQKSLDAMEIVDGQIVPDHNDEKISEWLNEEKEKNPDKYTKYLELHKLVLETDKIVKGE